jgi:hypothetical protein
LIRLLLFLLLAGALVTYAFRVYLRVELPVRGMRVLSTLRAGALVTILALLFDPQVPAPATGGAPGAERLVLLDASVSMGAGGGAPWREATRAADSLAAAGWRVVPFGASGVSSAVPSIPNGNTTLLAPALEHAAESGARQVVVLSDLRFEDRDEAARALEGTPMRVTFRDVGADVANAGVASFRVSDVAHEGDTATAALAVFAQHAGDSVAVDVRDEDHLVLSRSVPAPGPGRIARATFALPPSRVAGQVRYRAVVRVPGDAYAADDTAVAYATVGRPEGGLVMVALRPDWDARALLDVLEDATGLRATGYLRVGADRFVPMGRALERGRPADSTAVRRAAAAADLLVVQGLGSSTEAWGRTLPRLAAREVLWPLDSAAAAAVGVHTGSAREGEWYASQDVPASPLAGDLAGGDFRDLPPLTGVLPVADAGPGSTPLGLQLRGSGRPEAALVLRGPARLGGRRRREAVVLASGFWRWAARDGAGRDAYRRLWSGVAGWLLEPDTEAVSGDVRPEPWVQKPGRSVHWLVPGAAGESAHLSVKAAADAAGTARAVLDTVLAAGASAATPPLPAGTYAYVARGPGDAVARGRFDVEDRTLDMLPARGAPRVADADAISVSAEAAAAQPPQGTRPLRTSPWPYLLILGLVSAEWVGRRRMGLR